MADNVQVTAGSGTSVATDDVSGVHYQRVKPSWGADGSATDVSDAAPLPTTPGASASVTGLSTYSASLAGGSTPTTVKSAAARLYGLAIGNPNTQTIWIQLFESSATPTVGTSSPKLSYPVPPGDGSSIYGLFERVWPVPVSFSDKLHIAITTTQSGSTAPTLACRVNVEYA